MAQKMIEAMIDAEGGVTIEVHNASGAEGEALTEDLEKALGTVTDRKRDYYQRSQSQQQQTRA
jgi:Protein of unknown function (DUF2997)